MRLGQGKVGVTVTVTVTVNITVTVPYLSCCNKRNKPYWTNCFNGLLEELTVPIAVSVSQIILSP